MLAGSLSEPVPRHSPARASPAAVQGVARRILRAPTRTVSGCQASAMFVLHGPSVVCGHHRLSGFSGCSLGIPRWHLSLHAAGRCQDSSGRFLSKVYLRLPLPEAAADEAPMELPELRLPFRGKVSLHPQGSGAPRGPKALGCESRPQWLPRLCEALPQASPGGQSHSVHAPVALPACTRAFVAPCDSCHAAPHASCSASAHASSSCPGS